jgi:hypothetical protein
MIHDLILGHLDPAGIAERRRTVLKRLEMGILHRLLKALGGTDAEGHPTLGGARARFEDGCVVVPWLGGRTNRISEEFALRMQRETGCVIADLGHRSVIEPEQLQGLSGQPSRPAQPAGGPGPVRQPRR